MTPSLGVLGTGQVGQAIARRAAEVGYDVVVGARSATSTGLEVFVGAASIDTGRSPTRCVPRRPWSTRPTASTRWTP